MGEFLNHAHFFTFAIAVFYILQSRGEQQHKLLQFLDLLFLRFIFYVQGREQVRHYLYLLASTFFFCVQILYFILKLLILLLQRLDLLVSAGLMRLDGGARLIILLAQTAVGHHLAHADRRVNRRDITFRLDWLLHQRCLFTHFQKYYLL